MHLHTVRRPFVASNWRLIPVILLLAIVAAVPGQIIDEVVAKLLTIIMRRSQRFALMDVPTFHQSRYPYELLIVAPITLLIAIVISIMVYVFSPALCVLPNTAFISLIRVTESSTSSPLRDLRNNIWDSKKKVRLSQQHKTALGPGTMTVE